MDYFQGVYSYYKGTTDNNVLLLIQTIGSVVRKYAPRLRSMEEDDLLGFCFYSLMFENPVRLKDGFSIEQKRAYLQRMVRGRVVDYFDRQSYLPWTMRKLVRKLDTITSALEQKLQRPPNEDEIAAEARIPVEKVHRALLESKVKFFPVNGFDGERTDEIADPRSCTTSGENFRAALAQRLMKGLSSRQSMILYLHYFERKTLAEIADFLGLPATGICQQHDQAICHMRERLCMLKKRQVCDL